MIRTATLLCAVIGSLLAVSAHRWQHAPSNEKSTASALAAARPASLAGCAASPNLAPSSAVQAMFTQPVRDGSAEGVVTAQWTVAPERVAPVHQTAALGEPRPSQTRRFKAAVGTVAELKTDDAAPQLAQRTNDRQRDSSVAPEPPTLARRAAPETNAAEAPTLPSVTLRPEVLAAQRKARQALDHYRPRQLNTRDHDAWEVMHSLIAYGVDQQVQIGGPGGRSANAIGWLCFNGPCKGKRLFYLSNNRLQALKGPGVQGHHGQFLAMLAQSRVMLDYPIKVEGRDFTVADLVEFEKATCIPRSELTFKLIALAHYLDDLDDTWQSEYGHSWSIPRLIQEEITQPISGAPCGGTHRLFGLSYAVQRRTRAGEPIDGEYARAQKYIRAYHRYTFGLQNRDGSFSTEWFTRPGNRNDVGRKIQTSGHILEWLVLSLSEDEFQGDAMCRAINFLSGALISGQHRQWEIGPLGHALHALLMYDQRVESLQHPQPPRKKNDAEATAEEKQPPPRAALLPELIDPGTFIR